MYDGTYNVYVYNANSFLAWSCYSAFEMSTSTHMSFDLDHLYTQICCGYYSRYRLQSW